MQTKLKIKVVPGSKEDAVAGWLDDVLKIKIKAPAEKGKANKSVMEFLAVTLNIDQRDIEIAGGFASPYKTLVIHGDRNQQERISHILQGK